MFWRNICRHVAIAGNVSQYGPDFYHIVESWINHESKTLKIRELHPFIRISFIRVFWLRLIQSYEYDYPGYQSQKIIKRKNKEGKKVGSGQMVTSIVGIDQWEAYIPNRVYRFCEIWLDSVSHMTRLRWWSEKLIQTVVITTMANVSREAVENWKAFQQKIGA